jgi:uncharacterized protein (DUF2141 family)
MTAANPIRRMAPLGTAAIVLLLLTTITPLALAADLIVTVSDIRNSTGSIYIAVFDSDSAFMKPQQARATGKLNANKGQVQFVFHDLPAGTYAVSTFHDENGNKKLDLNNLGVPIEGYAFSNDAQGTSGPPRFAQAAFSFDGKADKSITCSLNY